MLSLQSRIIYSLRWRCFRGYFTSREVAGIDKISSLHFGATSEELLPLTEHNAILAQDFFFLFHLKQD